MLNHQLELDKIREEFSQNSNLQVLSVKYFNDTRPEVRCFLAEHEWAQIQASPAYPYDVVEIKNFINRYRNDEYEPIALLVVEAMHVDLHQHTDLSLDEFNQQLNALLRYAIRFDDHQQPKAALALCDVYWYKAQQLKDKDFFKARHFYQKIVNEAQKIDDPLLAAKKIKALIAMMELQYTQQNDAARDKQLYLVLEHLNDIDDKENPELCEKVKDLLQFYIQHRIRLSEEEYDVVALNQFLQYVEEHEFLQFILLKTAYLQADWRVLSSFVFFYWILKERAQQIKFLEAYYAIKDNEDDLIKHIREDYQFSTEDRRDVYIDMLYQEREKYNYREKYRTMFKQRS
ncbi:MULTISPECIES: hypothetical protein [unclassified Acinetobacter]|uniref:hypothetical protein n=1 Tax=unclassified Acinetobacter TaxID=196816 RepID=UPI0035BB93A2